MERADSWVWLHCRPLVKFILHLVTGQTEIERLSRRHDIKQLQKSITLSKNLALYRNEHCKWDHLFQEDYAEELCAIKNITADDAKFRVTVALRELHDWKYALNQIEAMRAVKYDSQSEVHQTHLLSVWKELRPGRSLKHRKSNEWIELGFQGDDPATDFRGAGFLGLTNLVQWVSKQRGKEAFKVADTPGSDYFFASASLFLTMLSIQLVREMLVAPDYWVLIGGETVTAKFQTLFQVVAGEFAIFWLSVEDKSMMQFNVNLIGFSRLVKSRLVGRINQQIKSK